MEKIVETKKCKCGASFDITDKDMEFYAKISPIFGGKKYQIPSPTLCPDCRQQRRLSFRNERKLYRRKCDLTGKDVISIYNPQSGYSICDRHVWRSDAWDPMRYGRDFDSAKDGAGFSQSFFSQFQKLWKETPNVAIYNVNTVNSEYCNHCLGEKNCYMIFGCYENEDCMYGEGLGRSKDCMDALWLMYSSACYECVDVKTCYRLFWGQKCKDCSESYFLYNCSNCTNCVGCINQVNKSYCIENKQYSKEEYFAKLVEFDLSSYFGIENYKKKFAQMVKESVHKFADLISCENVTGDNLEGVKDSFYCFDMNDARDCKYCTHVMEMNDVYDAYGAGAKANLMYEIVDTGLDESKVAFTIVVYQSTNAYYSVNCHACHNIFGCVGLRNKEYCILNKQYTKEEYEKLVPQIIEKMESDGERGEFFSSSISPFGYNESIASDYFPASKEEVVAKGFKWSDYEAPFPYVDGILKGNEIPEKIKDVGDDILNKTIECEVSGKPFRIIRKELDFYRKYNLPIPHKHLDVRNRDRMALRNPKKLWKRKCDKCGISIETAYSPERKEVIHCEKCYNKEIY